MPEIERPILTIFSQPGCVQCTAAERHAKAKNIPYQKIDVTQNEDAYTLLTDDWGYQGVPVLYYDGQHVKGFDPDFMNTAQKALVAA